MQSDELEDGELSEEEDESINPYIPLERPPLPFEAPIQRDISDPPEMYDEPRSSDKPRLKVKRASSSDDSSSSDDDDEAIYNKRMKPSTQPSVKDKYSVWTKDPNDDLTDILNQVGMDERAPENDRNVENYPLPFVPRKVNKRQYNFFDKRRKVPFGRRGSRERKETMKDSINVIDPLDITETSTLEEVADEISKKLKEPKMQLILRIVIVLGTEKSIQLFEKTREIEKSGGMMILDGSRKRTSGGIFIFLVRHDKDVSKSQFCAIFDEEMLDEKRKRRMNDRLKKKKKKGRSKKQTKKANDEEDTPELSNPPPSPDIPQEENPPSGFSQKSSDDKDIPMELPELRLEKDIVCYDDDLFS